MKTALNVRRLRERTKLNQEDFWKRVMVTQSGGSRYESGRAVPGPVKALLEIAYGSQVRASRIVKRLRASNPRAAG